MKIVENLQKINLNKKKLEKCLEIKKKKHF